jgi:RNA polymerase sigma-70 factor, ECF subfamily
MVFLSQFRGRGHYTVWIRIRFVHEAHMCKSDEQYIQSCLDGHPEDYRHLVRRHEAALLAHLMRRLGGMADAEEAAQETFVRAYFALGKLKKPGSFGAWLLGIARRVAAETRRARRRRQKELSKASMASDHAADPPADTEVHSALRQAVIQLPEAQRQVVLLRYYEGFKCSQVAERLNVPIGTITKTLSRAYTALRETLRRQDGGGQRNREVLP